MAHLTKHHAVFGIIDKVISDVAAMGIVTGDTAHLTAAGFFEWIRLAAQGVAGSQGGAHNMGLVAEVTMTGQTQLVDRLDQLGLIGAAVGVVAGFAHAGLDRAVDKLLFLDLQRHI